MTTYDQRQIYLRRYTDLPSLIHILTTKKITLLDPKSWDDKNDYYFMSLYKKALELETLLALCFSEAPERYHHWKVFSHGPSGVCIYFKKDKLLKSIENTPGTEHRGIKYLSLEKARGFEFQKKDLPFIKRLGYRHEKEYRVIYSSNLKSLDCFDIDINLDSIAKITLSPWLQKNLVQSTRKVIKSVQGCSDLKVVRSTLISNSEWISLGEKAVY